MGPVSLDLVGPTLGGSSWAADRPNGLDHGTPLGYVAAVGILACPHALDSFRPEIRWNRRHG